MKAQITIDLTRDSFLSEFGKKTLTDRYLLSHESSPQETFSRASLAFSDSNDMAQRMYNYMSKLWMTASTPILSNAPLRLAYKDLTIHNNYPSSWGDQFHSNLYARIPKGLPISCFLTKPGDSIDELNAHTVETRRLSVSGGGNGAHWSDIRSSSDKAPGVIPFLRTHDADVLSYHQGGTRRGAYAAYLSIDHPDIVEFIAMRQETGGDANRKCLNLHHAVNITNKFINSVKNDLPWDLIDPHTKEIKETLKSAKELWWLLLDVRHETGEPMICNLDKANEFLPQTQKDLGLHIHGSNLCSEILLPTSVDRTAVCCLSSINVEKYAEWKDDPYFIKDITRFLDNVLEYFIIHGESLVPKATYSAARERSIGIGVLGWHAFLQKNMIPMESVVAMSWNKKIFSYIKSESVKASQELAIERGESPDMIGTGMRNAHLLAVAPNASSSIYGNTSPSIEPWRANAFSQRTTSGLTLVKNEYLDNLLRIKYAPHLINDGDTEGWLKEQWKSILTNKGSVQHLNYLELHDKYVFKTAIEIDQNWLVQHALDRQPFICQSQSLNLFFTPEVDAKYISDVHWRAISGGIKTLYYLRTEAAARAENISTQATRKETRTSSDCLACE